MTAAFTHARMVGARRVACASTGNTSASLAVYLLGDRPGLRAIIFIGAGKIAYGKLAQALDHGALTDPDRRRLRRRHAARPAGRRPAGHLPGQQRSIPFRLEGQKTIMYRVLEALRWEVARLDRRARRQPGQLQRLRQGVHRAAAARPDRPRAAPGRDQRRRAPTRSTSSYEQHGLRWNDGRPDMDQVDGYYGELDAERMQGLDDRQRHRDQPAGEPEEVPAGAGLLRRRGPRGDRPGDPGRQGQGRRRRAGLRAGQRRQRRRGQAAARGGRDRPVATASSAS